MQVPRTLAHSGGDNSVWAADYTGTDTLNTGTYGADYGKITITMDDPGKNCAGIYTYGRYNTTTANVGYWGHLWL